MDKLKKLYEAVDLLESLKLPRAQKYEAANSGEKYEYGLSDW